MDPAVAGVLRAAGHRVQAVQPFEERHEHGDTWVNQLTKLKLWSMTQYDMMWAVAAGVPPGGGGAGGGSGGGAGVQGFFKDSCSHSQLQL